MELAPDITPEDLKVFLEETEEQLQLLDEDILKLEREGASDALVQEIFRAAHTIKGSAATIGHSSMTDVGHAAETLLEKLRNGALSVSTALINALLHSLDTLRAFKEQLAGETDDEPNIASVVAELEAVSQDGESAAATADSGPRPLTIDHDALATALAADAEGRHVARVTVVLADGCGWPAVRAFQVLAEADGLGEVIATSPTHEEVEREAVGRSIEIAIIVDGDTEALERALSTVEDVESVSIEAMSFSDPGADGARAPVEEADTGHQRAQQTVRIDVERLDSLANMIGELVIYRTRIDQIGKILETRYKDDDLIESLNETAGRISKVVTELQEDVMQARMLPVGTVFRRFTRMVRDLAMDMGKQIDFVMEGEDTEIDRTIIERIHDPLIHLLRNAVDHGIETPDVRAGQGKPETASLTLSAYHDQGHIAISVKDDGAGIDTERLKAKVVEKGLLSEEEAARLSESEALNLVFLPGSSTADHATEVSGRGVGMDIVRSNIEAINGFVTVETVPGQGTQFILRLPLTLATVHSLLVKLGRRDYALPLVYVTETVRLHDADITTVGGKKELLRVRDQVMPLIRLPDVLPGRSQDVSSADAGFAVIVNSANKVMALGVDSLSEPQEIVVKTMGDFIGDVKGITGASILGDGRVVLIVDVPSVVNAAGQAGRGSETAPADVISVDGLSPPGNDTSDDHTTESERDERVAA